MTEAVLGADSSPSADALLPPDEVAAALTSSSPESADGAPEDESHQRGSILGDLVFLVRYAFGRY